MKLRIEKCIYGGAGLARDEGKAIFVPLTLPGELVQARITEDKQSFANAELESILQPAPERTSAPCPYFGACGGCHYQHAAYPYQIEIKRSILHETLERARLSPLPEIVPVSSAPLGYRNRVRLHISERPFTLSYKRRGSHQNLPIQKCPISAPVLNEAIAAINQMGESAGLTCFSEVEFFTNQAQNQLLLSLWTNKYLSDTTQVLDALREVPALSGAAVFTISNEKHQSKKIAQWGEQSLTYEAGGHRYRASIGSFFQVNRFLIDQLTQIVCNNRSGKLAWDLYAGVGLFSVALAETFDRVIAVESAPSSSQDLRANLPAGKHTSVTNHTLAFLRQQTAAPDLIVLDPPRTGLGKEITALLTKVRAKTLVYVSCDPATLSRDLKSLVESGYRLREMYMVDMFPQTFHLESVAVLSLD